MKDKIIRKLIKDLGYSNSVANKTADDLCKLKYPDLNDGLKNWLNTNAHTMIIDGKYSTHILTEKYNMTYPAALIFLDWYRTDPKTAASVLKMRM
ncbi:MAG: hypothetical protein E7571_00285 [Ruminococcaceae bacterium]|nr:hypothetical protein [Oscillospiraceae bacterium]